MARQAITTGKGTFFLDQYPEQAWEALAPSMELVGDSRQVSKAAQAYYETVAFLYRCVSLRQHAITRVPWAILRGETEVWLSTEPTPPAQLQYLAKMKRLLSLTEAALCLAPEAFWFKERNRARIISLHWHAPNSVKPKFDERSGLTGFVRGLGNGRSINYEVDDYVYFALPNPMHETLPGKPPAQAALAAAGVLYNIDAFSAAYFDRGAIKATLLTVEGNPLPAEMERLESWWKRFFSGSKQAWQTAAVRAGVTPVVVGEGMESLAQSELSDEKRRDIAAALGIPLDLIMSDAANYATARQSDLSFYDKTIIPAFDMIVDILNESLLQPYGFRMEMRPEEMAIYQENEEERSNSFLQYVQAGIKPSIAAEILGVALPYGIEYSMLDPEPVPAPAPAQAAIQQLEPQSIEPTLEQQKTIEIARFKRWARKRINPNPTQFQSDLLSDTEKAALLTEAQSSETGVSFRRQRTGYVAGDVEKHYP